MLCDTCDSKKCKIPVRCARACRRARGGRTKYRLVGCDVVLRLCQQFLGLHSSVFRTYKPISIYKGASV